MIQTPFVYNLSNPFASPIGFFFFACFHRLPLWDTACFLVKIKRERERVFFLFSTRESFLSPLGNFLLPSIYEFVAFMNLFPFGQDFGMTTSFVGKKWLIRGCWEFLYLCTLAYYILGFVHLKSCMWEWGLWCSQGWLAGQIQFHIWYPCEQDVHIISFNNTLYVYLFIHISSGKWIARQVVSGYITTLFSHARFLMIIAVAMMVIDGDGMVGYMIVLLWSSGKTKFSVCYNYILEYFFVYRDQILLYLMCCRFCR